MWGFCELQVPSSREDEAAGVMSKLLNSRVSKIKKGKRDDQCRYKGPMREVTKIDMKLSLNCRNSQRLVEKKSL